MRFNWDAIIPSVALMHDDPNIDPIKGTGFEVERGKNPGEFTLKITILEEPKPDAEPTATD